MPWGTVQIGRMTVRETYTLDVSIEPSDGTRSVTLSGQESTPPLTAAEFQMRLEDFQGLKDMIIPVIFTHKDDFDGYYFVDSASANLTNWTSEIQKFNWSVKLVFLGADTNVDIESRLTGVARANAFSLTGNKWHAPSIGHYAYYTGSTPPSGTVTRTGSDGAITVYRTVPAGINPRWAVAVEDYYDGAVEVITGTTVRTGTNFAVAASGWVLDNGLVNVSSGASGALNVQAYSAGSYRSKTWNISVGSSGTVGTIANWETATVLRNDPEMSTVRLMDSRSPGRTILDLSLRRGSKFVEGYLQTDSSTSLAAWTNVAETTTNTAASGYVVASGDDANNLRYVAGSAKSFTYRSTGGLYKDTTTTLDFFIGTTTSGAVSGDSATDLRDQYIGAMAEMTMGVKR